MSIKRVFLSFCTAPLNFDLSILFKEKQFFCHQLALQRDYKTLKKRMIKNRFESLKRIENDGEIM